MWYISEPLASNKVYGHWETASGQWDNLQFRCLRMRNQFVQMLCCSGSVLNGDRAMGLRFLKRSPIAATTNRTLEGSHPHAHGHQCGQNDVIATPFCPSCPPFVPHVPPRQPLRPCTSTSQIPIHFYIKTHKSLDAATCSDTSYLGRQLECEFCTLVCKCA